MPLHRRPRRLDYAEHDGVAIRAVGQELMVAQHAVLLRADPRDRLARAVVEPVRAKLDRDAAKHLERVREQQQLALGIDARALSALRVPGVADLEPAVRGVDVEIARA